ncbi:MAG: membrane protein insertion efficiency factor YidD [Spirochaetaceae bacterium]|nr:membrane protein insertion efficiency factor YidD [Spirochaetaceae bacterium]
MQLRNLFNNILIGLVIIYKKLISPLLPRACIYEPSCSSYAIEALKKYGPLKGSFLSIKRILRCHPFSKGGDDPVP